MLPSFLRPHCYNGLLSFNHLAHLLHTSTQPAQTSLLKDYRSHFGYRPTLCYLLCLQLHLAIVRRPQFTLANGTVHRTATSLPQPLPFTRLGRNRPPFFTILQAKILDLLRLSVFPRQYNFSTKFYSPTESFEDSPAAKIPSPHSLAAILSPSAPPEEAAGATRSVSPKRTHAEAFAAGDQPYLHPASPTQHRTSISSTALSTREADDRAGGAMKGGQEGKKPRSSIACSRCRRSKVKCKLSSFGMRIAANILKVSMRA